MCSALRAVSVTVPAIKINVYPISKLRTRLERGQCNFTTHMWGARTHSLRPGLFCRNNNNNTGAKNTNKINCLMAKHREEKRTVAGSTAIQMWGARTHRLGEECFPDIPGSVLFYMLSIIEIYYTRVCVGWERLWLQKHGATHVSTKRMVVTNPANPLLSTKYGAPSRNPLWGWQGWSTPAGPDAPAPHSTPGR